MNDSSRNLTNVSMKDERAEKTEQECVGVCGNIVWVVCAEVVGGAVIPPYHYSGACFDYSETLITFLKIHYSI